MSSPILDYRTSTPDVGIPPSGTSYFAVAPTINALRSSPTSLEAVTTVDLTVGLIIIFVINNSEQSWQLQDGNADGATPTHSLQPGDYNSSTNNVKWTKVGGY